MSNENHDPEKIPSNKVDSNVYSLSAYQTHQDELDAEFGGPEARKRLERQLLWKLDMRMSILVFIYILNYIDRNNAGAARLRGFEADLHLKGQEFATLLSILYVGYILMQIPSNMFLNWIGKPSIYLPSCMIIWGTISILTGITKSFVGALLTRFFLGFVEAAFFPGALFLLSKWYTKSELGSRTAILYCGNIISNAFGSLMASGILDGMDGKLGHAAWSATLGFGRTITLVLCAPPFIVAAVAAFVLARHSDKSGERFWHITTSLALGIVGFIIAISTMNTAARYVSLFLMAQSYAGFVCFYAWLSNTFPRPPSKRAVALALVNAFSQLGNIAGSYVWPTMWGPTYRNSYAICIACQGLTIVMLWIFRMHLKAQNDKMDEADLAKGVQNKGFSYFVGRRDPKQAARDAIVDLRQQLQLIEKKESFLQKKIEEEISKARANAVSNKAVATAALRRKKMFEAELDKLQGARLQLEMQVNTLESANLNAETMAAMKKGSDALKHIHYNLNIDKVDATMNEINAQRELANEIADAISNPVNAGMDLDETDLEQELADLEQEELDTRLNLPDHVPVHTPVGPSRVAEAPHRTAEEEEERELRELQASLAMLAGTSSNWLYHQVLSPLTPTVLLGFDSLCNLMSCYIIIVSNSANFSDTGFPPPPSFYMSMLSFCPSSS
ncbi:hypothetical protein EW146_g6915 [Bondarzewia mesenterica]|uniref:Major facilitator superfamily (MFS) profile domain-containing protein n=1 Tax=Bondarzewia mesenterica TaxID=1095465 RepID=A0A4S4LM84_9AGAM|nr:hypothetical protein EW146_g6915 [Bondarzewia mesenterica]